MTDSPGNRTLEYGFAVIVALAIALALANEVCMNFGCVEVLPDTSDRG